MKVKMKMKMEMEMHALTALFFFLQGSEGGRKGEGLGDRVRQYKYRLGGADL